MPNERRRQHRQKRHGNIYTAGGFLTCNICNAVIALDPVRATDPNCPYVACSQACLIPLDNRWREEKGGQLKSSKPVQMMHSLPAAPVVRPSAERTFVKTALVVQQPWADMLLEGTKTIEIRNQSCYKHVGTRIAIAVSGTKQLHGEVNFVKCEKISFATFETPPYKRCHCIEDMDTTQAVRKYKTLFAWHMASPVKYAQPVPFHFPHGAIKWVTLPPCTFPSCAPAPPDQHAAPSAPVRVATDIGNTSSSIPSSAVVPSAALAVPAVAAAGPLAPSFRKARAALRRAFPRRRVEVTNDHLLSLHAREACTLLGYIHDLTPMDGRCACG